ncbi:MAG: SOS regulatory protein LexA [Kiritimatiellia bacterium]|jgi:SOS regulatory protein LexA
MPRTTDIEKKIEDLKAFYRANGRMPGYTEMLDIFQYRSKNAVYKLLKRLHELQVVRKEASGKISPGPRLTGAVQLLGSIRAGFPVEAEEQQVEMINLDEFLVRTPDTTFMLVVTGDSMVDAGIYEDDLVLVERQETARNGDIVVAQVDGEWTLKYFKRKNRQVSLEPANKKYKTIIPKQELTIGGVVKAVIRKYR